MNSPVKRVALLGSTGSIGCQTLDVVRTQREHFEVIALAAGNNIDLLAEQIREFRPRFVCWSANGRPLPPSVGRAELLPLEDMAICPEADIIVVATSGKAGLQPTLNAVKAGKVVALANKESLVMAGEIIITEARRSGARILPVDSEHSAIWQCLNGEKQKASRIILTASGGPFRGYSASRMKNVTVQQALAHPSWQMGKKVTIDSATLMNKGLEVTEAHWLFDMAFDNITTVVHPQSIVHSMVEFADGSVKAQLSWPDMRLPIQYALTYPDRLPNPELRRLNWSEVKDLTFEEPDLAAFPCLRLAVEAGKQGGTYPAVLCAADEVAVELFLSQRIGFTDIARLVEETLAQHESAAHPTIEEILAADAWTREKAMHLVGEVCP